MEEDSAEDEAADTDEEMLPVRREREPEADAADPSPFTREGEGIGAVDEEGGWDDVE